MRAKPIRPILWLIIVIAITSIVLVNFVFSSTPELFPGGYKIGVIVNKLCLAYVAAFIFYALVVHYKSVEDFNTIKPFITVRVERIIGNAIGLSNAIRKAIKLPENSENLVTASEIRRFTEEIDMFSPAPFFRLNSKGGVQSIWWDYLRYYQERTLKEIDGFYTVKHLCPSDLVSTIVDIEDCHHYNLLNQTAPYVKRGMKVNSADATALGLIKYMRAVEKLQSHKK